MLADDLMRLRLCDHEAVLDVCADLQLRPMKPSDISDLAALYKAAYPPELVPDLQTARAEMESSFAGEFGILIPDASLIARVDAELAGAIMTTTHSIWDEDLPGAFVIDLFADPRHRGKGIGTALIMCALESCRAAGEETVSLRIGEGTSPAAFKLYRRIGFRPLDTAG
jgi:GNAT superfamily N-acetyltransferase